MESGSVDEHSSSSDDSFCEHGYPLHEEPPTIEKVSDKAVITVQEQGNDEDEQMFLIPLMKGESPLNETLKQIVDLNYEPDEEYLKTVSLDQRGNKINKETMSALDDSGTSFADTSNGVKVKTENENSNSSQEFDNEEERHSIKEEVNESQSASNEDSLDKDVKDNEDSLDKDVKDEPDTKLDDPEYYKMMMGALWSSPLAEKIKQIAESDEGVEAENGTSKDPEEQVNDYTKLLGDLSTAMDDSMKNSSVDNEGKEQPFVCVICEWGFTNELDLINHERLHSGERPYQCEYCIANFQDKTALMNHRRQHTGEKPFECDICDAKFSQKHSLTVHKNVHSGEKKYKCDVCDASFVCRSNLNVHKRIHTGAKPYECEFCKSCYAQKSQLTVHLRIHTGERPYKCQLCPSAFSVRGHLVHHIRSHTGEKPYKCDECGAAFTKRCNLRVHKRAHTGEKPYKCQFCDQAFHLKNMLTKHLLNYHRIAKKLYTPPLRSGAPEPPILHGLVPSNNPSAPWRRETVSKSIASINTFIPPVVETPRSRKKDQKNQKTPQINNNKRKQPESNSTETPDTPTSAPKNSRRKTNSSKKQKLENQNGNIKVEKDELDSNEHDTKLNETSDESNKPYTIRSSKRKERTARGRGVNYDDDSDSNEDEKDLYNADKIKKEIKTEPDTSFSSFNAENYPEERSHNIKNSIKTEKEFDGELQNNHKSEKSSKAQGFLQGFGSTGSLLSSTGYQSSPVAQRMAQHFQQSSPQKQDAAMKNMMEAYAAAGLAPLPGLKEGYKSLFTGMNMIGQQQLPGATGHMSPGYSDGSCS